MSLVLTYLFEYRNWSLGSDFMYNSIMDVFLEPCFYSNILFRFCLLSIYFILFYSVTFHFVAGFISINIILSIFFIPLMF